MTKKDRLVTAGEDASDEEVLKLMHKHRIEKVLVTNVGSQLRGPITVEDIQKSRATTPAAKAQAERLSVCGVVGAGGVTYARH